MTFNTPNQHTAQSGDIDDIDCCEHTRIWSYIGAILHAQCVMSNPTTFEPIFHQTKTICMRTKSTCIDPAQIMFNVDSIRKHVNNIG